jgi:hypothetical protein
MGHGLGVSKGQQRLLADSHNLAVSRAKAFGQEARSFVPCMAYNRSGTPNPAGCLKPGVIQLSGSLTPSRQFSFVCVTLNPIH